MFFFRFSFNISPIMFPFYAIRVLINNDRCQSRYYFILLELLEVKVVSI